MATIPATLADLPVVRIGEYAFFFRRDLTSVTIPDSVTSIGDWAFSDCARLAAVNIPNSVTNLGSWVFAACTALTRADIGKGVTRIPDSAFYDCTSLRSLWISEGVIAIGESAFGNCRSLTELSLPDSVASIGDSAFSSCENLMSITLSSNLVSIGYNAFESCANLTGVVFPPKVTDLKAGAFSGCDKLSNIAVDPRNSAYTSLDGVLFTHDGRTLLLFPPGKGGSYVIPEGVTAIGDRAFYACSRLAGLSLPSSLVSIGSGAFDSCVGLTNISIPPNVSSIGDAAFQSCSMLNAISVDTLNAYYSSVDGVLFNKSASVLLQYPDGRSADYRIPSGAVTIGDAAFAFSRRLITVTVPGSVTRIRNYAFASCTNLAAIYFEGNAPALGVEAFYGDNRAVMYYLPGAAGWGATFGGLPTAVWNRPVQASSPGFHLGTNEFGFAVNWAGGEKLVVEACTNVANSTWVRLRTNTLVDGWFYFTDPDWTNFPARFYRLRTP